MNAIARARRWLADVPARDEIERQQAALLQLILIVLILLVGALLALAVTVGSPRMSIETALGTMLILAPLLVPIVLFRRGQFRSGSLTMIVLLLLFAAANLFSVGAGRAAAGLLFAIPMTLAALSLSRRYLAATAVAAIVSLIVYGLGLPAAETDQRLGAANIAVGLGLFGLFLDPFGVAMRQALTASLRRTEELETARDSLVERSAELQNALLQLRREMAERETAEAARRAIEAKVLEVQRLESLGVLAGGIAHDFNNLLVAIMGNASLALMDLPSDSPARASIVEVETASQRAAELAREMLAYSGRSRFSVEPIDLSEVVRELMTLLQVSIGKGVVMKLRLADEPIVVDCDAAQLRQVIMNLVINGSDAIGERSGIVSVSVGRLTADAPYLATLHPEANLRPGDFATLEVSDTGIGMDPATQARIFDPFFTTKFTGRGLGLAAVQGIVRGHHGGLKVYSEPRKGTTFKIILPLSLSSPAAVAEAAATLRTNATVLVVDDEPSVRTVARRLLASFGMTVIETGGGQGAIDTYRDRGAEIDVVLLDLTMPDIGGAEAFRQIRTMNPDASVVLMSGYHEEEASSAFAGKGLSGFVQKPFTPASLGKAIRTALGGTEPVPD